MTHRGPFQRLPFCDSVRPFISGRNCWQYGGHIVRYSDCIVCSVPHAVTASCVFRDPRWRERSRGAAAPRCMLCLDGLVWHTCGCAWGVQLVWRQI